MSRTGAVLIFAVLGWLSFSPLAQAQEASTSTVEGQPKPGPKNPDPAADRNRSGADDEGKSDHLVTALEKIEAAIREMVPSKDPAKDKWSQDNEIADLQAQQEMAYWAKAMFWTTLISVLSTFAGLFLIARTLHHTRRAADFSKDMVDEAKETTKAARETISVTREIGQAQVRAYLSCPEASYEIQKEYVHITLTVRNNGQSPAQSAMIFTGLILFNNPADERSSVINLPEGDKLDVIPAGGEITTSVFAKFSDLGSGIKERLYGASEYFTITHMIEWVDVFGRQHHIEIWLHPPSYTTPAVKGRIVVRRKDSFKVFLDKMMSHEDVMEEAENNESKQKE